MTRRTRKRRHTSAQEQQTAAAPERQWPKGMPPPSCALPHQQGKFRNPTGKYSSYEFEGVGAIYWPCGTYKTLPPSLWEAAVDAGLEWAGYAKP